MTVTQVVVLIVMAMLIVAWVLLRLLDDSYHDSYVEDDD